MLDSSDFFQHLAGAAMLAAAPAAPPAGEGSFLPDVGMLPALIGVVFLFYFILLRPQRREQAQRQSLLDNLKKNDHVLTSGGIHGVVTNVQKETDEVIIKVDESNNTKLKMARSAIVKLITDEKPSGKPAN